MVSDSLTMIRQWVTVNPVIDRRSTDTKGAKVPRTSRKKTILSLQPPANGNRIQYDPEIPGFGVRITSNGAISFVLNYRLQGRERRYTIGRYPELTALAARERAIQLRGKIIDGIDPLQQRNDAQSEPTIDDLAKDYLERYARPHKRASSLRNDREMLEKSS